MQSITEVKLYVTMEELDKDGFMVFFKEIYYSTIKDVSINLFETIFFREDNSLSNENRNATAIRLNLWRKIFHIILEYGELK